MGKLITGLTTGALMGVAIGMMVSPDLDRRTQKNLRRARKRMMDMAEDTYENVMHMIR
jgi:gas vesicle protein